MAAGLSSVRLRLMMITTPQIAPIAPPTATTSDGE
jgi:hypothetical protein